MLFTAPFAALLAVASAFPSELVARAPDLAPQVLQNLTTTVTDAGTLNTTVNAQAPGNTAYTTPQLVAILNANSQLQKDLNSTAATANASSVWTSSESASIYNKINNDVKPAVLTTLDNLIAHYPNVQANGLVSAVKSLLQDDRELTRELGNALLAKLVDPSKTSASAAINSGLAKFDQAITKFSS